MKIYSKFEAKGMYYFQEKKDSFLFPITKPLTKLGISANFVSLTAGTTAVVVLFLALFFDSPLIFIIGIWFHFFLDGLDGSLSRAQAGKGSVTNGLLADLISDSAGIICAGLYLLFFNIISLPVTIIFIIFPAS